MIYEQRFDLSVSKGYYFSMKNGRNTAGQFSEGNAGRPKGSRNKATIAIESLLQGQAEASKQTAFASKAAGSWLR
jgi:hypothetical protein